MKGTVSIGDIRVEPGDKVRGWMEVTEDFDGPVRFPLLAINGCEPGTCLAITSGLYGDEYTGMEAVYQLFRDLKPEQVSGQILAIPMLNTPAFDRISRLGPDSVNMNRVLGGREDGFLTEKISYSALEKVISLADYAIELIEIGMYHRITSIVALVKQGRQYNLDYAKAYGCDLLWTGSAALTVFRRAVADKGVKVILAQISGEGRCYPQYVDYELRGLKNLLKYLDIINGEPEDPQQPYRFYDGFWIKSHTGGIFQSDLSLRQEVKKDDVLATVRNLLDQELEVIRAPHDGIIIGYRTVPRIHPGDWAVWVGRFLTEEEAIKFTI
jgi:predicted deacylase